MWWRDSGKGGVNKLEREPNGIERMEMGDGSVDEEGFGFVPGNMKWAYFYRNIFELDKNWTGKIFPRARITHEWLIAE